jgi:phosphatidate cytidylyltransferase
MTTNNFWQRVFTAVLGGTAFVFLLTFHLYTYYFLWGVIVLFCIWEWKNMFKLPFGLGLYIFFFLSAVMVFAITDKQNQIWLLLYTVLPLLLLKKVSFSQILYTLLGIIYLGIPVYILYGIVQQEQLFYLRILFVVTVVWTSDISAYLTGKYFGKHLLIPRISPKKTWEGLLGSFVFSAVTVFVWFQGGWVTEQRYIWVGILTAVSAPVGDLMESAIKRKAYIKDTSQFLPGHGGFLDRFDGFFFALATQYWIF